MNDKNTKNKYSFLHLFFTLDTNTSFDKQFRKIQLEGLLIFWVVHSFIQLYTNVYVIPYPYINQTNTVAQGNSSISTFVEVKKSREILNKEVQLIEWLLLAYIY